MNASWVAIDLMEFAVRTEDAVQSPEAALEWLRSFRDTLLMEGRNSRPMPWAVELLGMADVKIAKKSIARMQGQIVKIYGKDCDVDLECSKKYGEKYEKLKKILAAATHREAVDESATGCNHSQVAPTREDGEFKSDSGNAGNLESATACNPLTADGDIREDSLNVTDGSNSGALESGTSANHYDKEALDKPTISANSPAGAGVNLDSTHTISPDASSGNAEGVNTNGSTITRNGSRATRTSATSGQTFDTTETLDKAGAGEVPPENVSKKPSPALPVPAKRPHGEFGNVMLTDDEYAKLCGKCADADALITELDQYIESQGKAKKYKSHYATLLNWSRRKAQEAKPQQRYKNINDINQENYEKAMREIEAMCAGEAV